MDYFDRYSGEWVSDPSFDGFPPKNNIRITGRGERLLPGGKIIPGGFSAEDAAKYNEQLKAASDAEKQSGGG